MDGKKITMQMLKVVNVVAQHKGVDGYCAFCGRADYFGKVEHLSDCPVLLAQQIIADLSNEPQA